MNARYRDNGDGTVTDTVTGLQWIRHPIGYFTWEEANSLKVNFAGYEDWRLPSREELKTLVYFTDGEVGHFLSDGYVPGGVYKTPVIDKDAFPNTPLESFWTATPHWGDHAFAEAIDFFIGTRGYVARNKQLQVRMVRGVMK